jgi:YesN/AraC family two-component response regulator
MERNLIPLISLMDKVIAISGATARDLVQFFNIPAKKVYVTYLGVNPKRFNPVKEENDTVTLNKYGIQGSYFLYVGGFDWRKNCETILQSFARLTTSTAKMHKLVLVGNDAPTPIMNKDLEKILSQMIIEYCNIAKEAQTDKHSSPIKKCLQQIHNQTYDKCTVEGIAENLKVSSDYLSVLFKREMGIGLYSYILNAKIEEAKSLLDNSNFSISDIGESLGFCNGAYFSNVFKKLTGTCPKDYRMKKSSHAAVK